MTATSPSDATDDAGRIRECYRCDRTIAPEFLFRIEVEPSATLTDKYATSVRYCCENCAAAMNLSAFSAQWKANARR
ncbi:hypothetical protein [Halovivax gelatinilyticus]|uniref:hypothetical protein n=1 Tax=Halovivax gelatinilyticus TaxID=2961597 RepID=UPI0020CA8036|nr:hypothetical protein [Halovivax gelatinilyticus]